MKQKGFAPIFIALIVLGVLAVGGAGVWYATSGPKSAMRNDVPTPVVQNEEPSSQAQKEANESGIVNLVEPAPTSTETAPTPTVADPLPGSAGNSASNSAAINGICGPASSGIFAISPAANLCSAGTAGAVTRSGGNWQWNCNGSNGGTNSSCYANIAGTPPITPTPSANVPTPTQTQPPAVNGVCGSANGDIYASAPANELCSSGAPTSVSLVGSDWKWICSGMSGGANANCSAQKPAPTPTPVDGNCGSAYNGSYTSVPTSGLCSAGTAGAVMQVAGEWRWSCLGSNGGLSDSCFADVEVIQAVGGQCGSSNNGTYEAQPHGLCNEGTATAITQSNDMWNWSCNGSNGGTSATCQAEVEVRIPSYIVTLTRTGNLYSVSGHINYYGKGKNCSGPRYFDPVVVSWGDAGAEPTVTNMSFSANHEYFIENPTHNFVVSVHNSCFGVQSYRTEVVMYGDNLWQNQTETIPLHE